MGSCICVCDSRHCSVTAKRHRNTPRNADEHAFVQRFSTSHRTSVVHDAVRLFSRTIAARGARSSTIQRSCTRVKALVKATAGPGFVLKTVPEPSIRDDEVLIRVRRAGVCGTDVHIYDWDAWAQGRVKPPTVIGHEFAGEVVRVGSLVTDVHEGDRVTAEGHIVD